MSLISGPNIVTSGLVLYLDAGNTKSYPGSGTNWIDLSGNNNNGTLTNGPTFSSSNLGSIVFDGVDDYVALGTPSSLQFNSGSYSIDMWFKTPYNNRNQALFSYGNSSYNLYIQNDTNLRFAKARVVNDGNGSVPISNDIWYHIIFVNNIGTNTNYYKNGSFVQTRNFTATYTYTKTCNIGLADDEGYYFPGTISSVRVYNRALTANEILNNYNATKGRYGL